MLSPSQRLRQFAAASVLRGYRGNFKFLLDAVARHIIPENLPPAFQPQWSRLREKLGSEVEPFLLHFALVVPGYLRGLERPLEALLPERGGLSAPRLEQACGQVQRLLEAFSLARAVHLPLPQAAVPAARWLEAWLQDSASLESQLFELCAALSSEGLAQALEQAMHDLDQPRSGLNRLGEEVLALLASSRTQGLGDSLDLLIGASRFWPPFAFRGASPTALESLARSLPSLEPRQRTHRLLAMAWSRGPWAARQFALWKSEDSPLLPHPADFYTLEAGWWLDAQGQRHELLRPECWRLVPCPSGPVSCLAPSPQSCSQCGGALHVLLDLSGPPVKGQVLTVCLGCAQESGISRSPSQTHGPPDPATAPLRVRLEPFPPFAACHAGQASLVGTVGGAPAWLQDAEVPFCQHCGQAMSFLAQFDNAALSPPEEGMLYAFCCPNHPDPTAVVYQQT